MLIGLCNGHLSSDIAQLNQCQINDSPCTALLILLLKTCLLICKLNLVSNLLYFAHAAVACQLESRRVTNGGNDSKRLTNSFSDLLQVCLAKSSSNYNINLKLPIYSQENCHSQLSLYCLRVANKIGRPSKNAQTLKRKHFLFFILQNKKRFLFYSCLYS